MCGGGGGFFSNPIQSVSNAFSSVGNAITTGFKQIGDVIVNDVNAIGKGVEQIAHGQIGAAINTALITPFQDINTLTGGKNGVTTSTPAQGSSSGNINQPGNSPVGGSSASTVTQAGGAVSGVNQTTPMITINSPYPMNKNTLIGLQQ